MPRTEAETDRVQIPFNSKGNSACTQQSVSPCNRVHDSQCPEGFAISGASIRPNSGTQRGMTFKKAIEEHEGLVGEQTGTRSRARFPSGIMGRRSWAAVRDSIAGDG